MSAEATQPRISERLGCDLGTTVDADLPDLSPLRGGGSLRVAGARCALEVCDFDDTARNAISIGSDTIAAIAGGVTEARFGMPQDIATQAWSYLPADMRRAINGLYRTAQEPAEPPV